MYLICLPHSDKFSFIIKYLFPVVGMVRIQPRPHWSNNARLRINGTVIKWSVSRFRIENNNLTIQIILSVQINQLSELSMDLGLFQFYDGQ